MINGFKVLNLIANYITNTLNPEEKEQLKTWAEQSAQNKAFLLELRDPEKRIKLIERYFPDDEDEDEPNN